MYICCSALWAQWILCITCCCVDTKLPTVPRETVRASHYVSFPPTPTLIYNVSLTLAYPLCHTQVGMLLDNILMDTTREISKLKIRHWLKLDHLGMIQSEYMHAYGVIAQ